MLVYPVQFFLELLGTEAHRAQNADATGFADRNDHVAAMGKGENRIVDAELFTEFVGHGYGSTDWDRLPVSGAIVGAAMTAECQANWRFLTRRVARITI